MKKIFSALVLGSLLVLPVIGLAQDEFPVEPPGWGELSVCCEPGSVLARLTDWLFGILLIVAAIFIIVAAYMFVTATGDPDRTKKARDFVLYAIIGVLVAFVAKGLVLLVDRIVRG